MKITTNFIKQTKRHLCASGSILLPLAQKWGLVGLVAMVMLSAFGTQSVSAASITLTVPKEPLMFNITPSSGGTFGKSTAGTIKIQTDALAGYTLNIKAKDGKADLTNEATGNKISPISSDVSENDFMSKATYNNMWGFSFDKQGVSSNTFRSILDDAVGTKIGSTEVPNTAEDIYNIVLGARVDNSLATGAYSNTFIVVASANPVPYKVKYDPNADSDPVSGMPSNSTSAATSTQSFSLPSEEPKRSGYEFIGWCNSDSAPTKTENIDICDVDKTYKPGAPYTLSSKNENITMYAMWAKEDQVMQNWKGCAELKEHQTTTLVDTRDNELYRVRLLKDKQCWMIDDLRLGGTEPIKLTSNKSDVPADWTWTLPAGIENFSIRDVDSPAQIYVKEEGTLVPDTTNDRVGVYYSWYAATAGTGTYRIDTVEAAGSVCPQGWRLPTGNNTGEIITLQTLYSNAPNILGNADGPNFVASGRNDTAGYPGFQDLGINGVWWTSTWEGPGRAYMARVTKATGKITDFSDPGYHGESVRCIAR